MSLDRKTAIRLHACALKCGAKTRKGIPCKGLAMRNGRCRMHGGKSTGPRTEAGKAKIAAAQLKHGAYSKDFQADLQRFKEESRLFDKEAQKLIDLVKFS